MKIIIDTNVIFSALLNSNGKIADLIFNSQETFEFYSCSYMRYEIRKHWEKLKKISKLNNEQIEESRDKIFSQIRFINEEIIQEKIWRSSERLVHNVDADDIAFIALTTFLKGHLWTGDMELYNGLKLKGYDKILTTQELLAIRNYKM